MADQTITNDRHDGNTDNAPGTPTTEVYVRSLPWSLRHCGTSDAIQEARDIAAFLSETATTRRIDDTDPDDTALGDWKRGLELCFHLLIDKLDIASGAYKFPVLTHDRTAPHLCEREE